VTAVAEVDGCPCGVLHMMSADVLASFERLTAGFEDPRVLVSVPRVGNWRVPRVFIACHGLKAADLPAVAARYGFERVP